MLTETNDRADMIGLSALSQKIEQWRSRQPRSLGVSRVATALKVGYATLRERSGVEGVRKAARRPEPAAPALSSQFVEISDLSPIREEAVVEVTVPDGTRLTIRLKGSANVVALVNALRWRA